MKRVFLAAFLAILVLPACGGGAKGPSDSTTDSSGVSKDESSEATDTAGAEGTTTEEQAGEEPSSEIVMHVIKTVLE